MSIAIVFQVVALKFTVHVVKSFIKGHRKSGVISLEIQLIELAHLQWNDVRFLPVTRLHICGTGGSCKPPLHKSVCIDFLYTVKNAV